MPAAVLTLTSLLGAVAYLVTAALALAAVHGPRRTRVSVAWRWQLVAIVFVALAGWRLGLGEIRLQDDVREWAKGHGLYDGRSGVQSILTVGMLAIAAAGFVWLVLRGGASRSALALGSALALVLLSLARLASLHSLDELLYRTGPVHLNYLLDMGLTASAAGLAWLEISSTRARLFDDPGKRLQVKRRSHSGPS